MTRVLSFAVVFLTVLSAQAQKNISEPVISGEVLGEAYVQYQQDNYNLAIRQLDRIPKSDTNYVTAQYLKMVTLFEKEEFEKIEELAKEVIFDFDNMKDQFYLYRIKSKIELEEYDAAKALIKEVKEIYPLNFNYDLQLGIIKKKQEDYEGAKKVFQEILRRDAYNHHAHYELGILAAEEGMIVRAMISLQFSVMSNSGSDYLQKIFAVLGEISTNNYKSEREKDLSENDPFNEVRELIVSEVALKSNYQAAIKISDATIRQTDVLVQGFEYDKDSEDFWMQHYGEFIEKVKKKKMVEEYSLDFLKVIQVEVIQDLIKSNEKDLDKYAELFVEHFNSTSGANKVEIKGKTYDKTHFYSGGSLTKVGQLKNQERSGDWIVFYATGEVKANLNYKKSELTGYNEWYDEKGNLIQYYTLSNGKKDGEVLFPHDNGLPQIKGNFKNDKLDGALKKFYNNGLLWEVFEFKNGEKSGNYVEYSYSGDTISEGKYTKDELDGPYKEYYRDGSVYLDCSFDGGKLDGKYIKYFHNGQIMVQGQYRKGKEVGLWKNFYDNGQLELQYEMTDYGKADGPFIEYQYDGDTSRIGTLKKGKLHGEEVNYTTDEKVFSRIKYRKGKFKKYTYYDSLGNVLSEGKKYQVAYDQYGYKYFEGKHRGKHGRDGKWITYWKNGNVEEEKTYEKGTLIGPMKWYHTNGELKGECTYKEGYLDGYYARYYINGEVEIEGYYRDGDKVGTWKEYRNDGSIAEEYYYSGGDFTGFYKEYHADGSLHAESYYNGGLMKKISFFDTTGSRISTIEFNQGSGKYEPKAITGFEYIKGERVNNERHGKFEFMFCNGKPEVTYNYLYGTKQGEYINRHIDGSVYQKGQYDRGEKEGVWKTYYRNGQLRRLEIYKNNLLTDSALYYYVSGELMSVNYYDSQGELHGVCKDYYRNGQLETATTYDHGFKIGSYIYYAADGSPIYKKFYNGNQLIGYAYMKGEKWTKMTPIKKKTRVKTFYPDGQVALTYVIEENNYNGTYERHYPNGQLWTKEDYKDDLKHGDSETYFENGQLESKGKFVDGDRDGRWTFHREDGSLTEDLNYYHGYLHGTCKYYNDKGKLTHTVIYWYGYEVKITKH